MYVTPDVEKVREAAKERGKKKLARILQVNDQPVKRKAKDMTKLPRWVGSSRGAGCSTDGTNLVIATTGGQTPARDGKKSATAAKGGQTPARDRKTLTPPLMFLPATPSSRSRTLEGLIELNVALRTLDLASYVAAGTTKIQGPSQEW